MSKTEPEGCPVAAATLKEFLRAWDLREAAIRAHQEADDRLAAAEVAALAVFEANGNPMEIHDFGGSVRLIWHGDGPHLDVIRPPWSYELKPVPRLPAPLTDAELDEAAAYAALEDCGLAPPDADALASVLAAGMTTPGPDGPRPPENGDSRS